MAEATRILRQRGVVRKQLALLRLLQVRAIGTLEAASEWQGHQPLRAFRRVREAEFENYMTARRTAKAAGAAIFG